MNVTALVIFLLGFLLQPSSQDKSDDWRSLVPLTSTRAEVEKILGKPAKYFPTSGKYETSLGRFYVWYSNGKCVPGSDERQWDVPLGRMTNLTVFLYKPRPLESYVPNLKDLYRNKEKGGENRFLYSSDDESIIYETIMRTDGSEFVYSITVQPKKNHDLLCINRSNGPNPATDDRNTKQNSQLCCGRDNQWRGIRPLKSSREEVEKILGRPIPPGNVVRELAEYQTVDGVASILYSTGSCYSNPPSGWDVPEQTVVDIVFYPKAQPTFSELKLDLNKFEKRADPEITYIDEYSNYFEGVRVTVDREKSVILKFTYFPSENDKSRACKAR